MRYRATAPGKDPWTFPRPSDAEALAACGTCTTVDNLDSGIRIKGKAANIPMTITPSQSSFGWGDVLSVGGSVVKGLIPGPIDDLAIDAISRKLGNRGTTTTASAGPTYQPFQPTPSPCSPPRVRIGSTCVDPGAALPGGDPLFSPVDDSGPAGVSVFGMYMEPEVESRTVRKCRPGMVLGKDGKCYADSLPNKYRKYPKAPRLPITRSDQVAIARAASAEKRVEALAKKAGFKVSKKTHCKKK